MAQREVIGESGLVTSTIMRRDFLQDARVQVNVQVHKGGSTNRSGNSCSAMHKVELDELVPLSA
jgi:hypothetical protein